MRLLCIHAAGAEVNETSGPAAGQRQPNNGLQPTGRSGTQVEEVLAVAAAS
ncbi:hypothetical protein ACFLUA_02875 [Chloroflexota bacterium]